MKDRILNIIVIVAMIIIANYPMYKSLKETAKEVDVIMKTVQTEIVSWQRDVNIVQDRIEGIRNELVESVNKGLTQTNSILNKIKTLEIEAKELNSKIDNLKVNTINRVKESIKDNPKVLDDNIDKVKQIFDIKG